MTDNVVLYSVGIAIAAVGLLGWVVFLNNKKSATNRTFFAFSVVSIFWNLSNFIVYQVNDQDLGLWFVRLNTFFAVWYSFLLFRLFYIFPLEQSNIPPKLNKIVLIASIIASLLTLTPLVFHSVISVDAEGHVAQIKNGPAIPVFGMVAVSLIFGAIFKLLRKIRTSTGDLKSQLAFVLAGATITFTLHIIFNLIFPTLLDDPRFISLGAIFTFPFVFFTSYAIRRKGLLRVKVLTTEAVSLLLLALTFVEVLISESTLEIFVRSLLFAVLLFFSFILTRSVHSEVEQKEQLANVNKQLEQVNKHLKELDQAKSEFVSIASHQLRTPMTGIMGYLSMMVDGDFGKVDPKHFVILKNLLDESQRMIRLINLFLNVSKIEAGKFQITKKELQLLDVVEREVQSLSKIATDKGLQLIFTKPEKPFKQILVDADKIQDVLLNLIDNALKYTKQGSVTVSGEQNAEGITIHIKDTGIGISKENISELFNKFVRAQGIAQVHPDGSGLGLFIAKSIVEGHGGKIWIESEGEGKGTTFSFWLPFRGEAGTTTLKGGIA